MLCWICFFFVCVWPFLAFQITNWFAETGWKRLSMNAIPMQAKEQRRLSDTNEWNEIHLPTVTALLIKSRPEVCTVPWYLLEGTTISTSLLLVFTITRLKEPRSTEKSLQHRSLTDAVLVVWTGLCLSQNRKQKKESLALVIVNRDLADEGLGKFSFDSYFSTGRNTLPNQVWPLWMGNFLK